MVGSFFSPVSWNLSLSWLFYGLDLAPWQKVHQATLDLTNIQSRGRQPRARWPDPARQTKSYGPAAPLQLSQLQQKRRFKRNYS